MWIEMSVSMSRLHNVLVLLVPPVILGLAVGFMIRLLFGKSKE